MFHIANIAAKFYTATVNHDFQSRLVRVLFFFFFFFFFFLFPRSRAIFSTHRIIISNANQAAFFHSESASDRYNQFSKPRVEPRARYPVEFVIEWRHDVYAVIQFDWTFANYTAIRWNDPHARGEKLHAPPMKCRAFEWEIGSMKAVASTRSASNIFSRRNALARESREDLTRLKVRHPEICDETQPSRARGIYFVARDADKYFRARGSKSESECTSRTKRRCSKYS